MKFDIFDYTFFNFFTNIPLFLNIIINKCYYFSLDVKNLYIEFFLMIN